MAFAELAGIAWRNAADHAAAQRAASLDSLTGCLNHGAFQDRLREEIARTERHDPHARARRPRRLQGRQRPLGHLSGDALLRAVAELVRARRASLRPGRPLRRRRVRPPAARHRGARGRARDRPALAGAVAAAPPPSEGGSAPARASRAGAPGEDATHPDRARRPRAARGASARGERSRRAGAARRPVGRGALSASANGRGGWPRPAAWARGSRGCSTSGRSPRPRSSSWPARWACELRGLVRLTAGRRRSAVVAVAAATRRARRAAAADGAIAALPARAPDGARDGRRAATPDCGTARARSSPCRVYVGGPSCGARSPCGRPSRAPSTTTTPSSCRPSPTTSAPRCAPPSSTTSSSRPTSGTAEALAAALEAKDPYTADHAALDRRPRRRGRPRARADEDALRDLRYGAIFHDIGKIAIPDAILNKPGPLTRDEFEVVKRHPIVGEQILAPVPVPRRRAADRPPRPRALGRHRLPGRPARPADPGRRPHRARGGRLPRDGLGPPVPQGHRRRGGPRELREFAGTQFDPGVVEAFLRVLDRRGAMVGDLI